jgi:2-polyprenyl-6-methoxyphenol hydroxylase-like FAD-dependent oxidoreductase
MRLPNTGIEVEDRDGSSLKLGARLLVAADGRGSSVARLAGGPENAERASKILGKIDVPNVIRPAARPGIAFVGDAALAADPAFGAGISFAFMGAEWLVDETSSALDSRQALDNALCRYRRKFAWRLAPHHLQMADFSTARKITPLERRAFYRAAVDPVFARAFGEVLARERSVFHFLNPCVAGRLLIGDTSPSEAHELARTHPARPHQMDRREPHAAKAMP